MIMNTSTSRNVLVFLPNTLEKNKSGYIKGCHKKFHDCEAYYITEEIVSNNYSQCIGYIGKTYKNSKHKTACNLFINIFSNEICINNDCERNYSVVSVVYDYKGFKHSDVVPRECDNYGKHFKFLAEELRNSLNGSTNGRKSLTATVLVPVIFIVDIMLKVIQVLKPLLLYSATFLHFEENTVNLKWFLLDLIQKKHLSPKTGNILVAKIIDLTIGIVLLNWCLKNENDILNYIQTGIEDIITGLKGLLLYLMGSPIGLKLNHSFNNNLGKFFFYHISLWRVFLQGTQPLLRAYFRYLVLPGALGFSFQIAMGSDIISIATFHVYCIYVYAARLFSLQISGLMSLWRLFIGRKFNPLRQRVDSCKYTPDQLFIGTLGFTILLFLLPTTALYYAVFTTFRLVILLVNGLLLRLRFFLNTLPFYVMVLWVFNSSSVAGTVHIEWKNCEESKVEAKLKTLPLSTNVRKFIPDPVRRVEGKSFKCIFRNVLTGVLL
ncbi:hypothetical protein NQ315_001789 [Exocentrus adspersus]|uniref:Phosphatidylinositol N-acetylglucosaminyltransferase subunit Q n=1 Tax=Exocentrus adspersus TaxID=1586481 RepID=A0AAV8W9M3_9CUCU|nr:hypothetical protein NQ315_001789 [Exocentrus adspersus]